ncbi:metal-dependent transcriptional regulator [Aerococcaceae bacterium zg-ZJ1578]|uniref:metal-dependent transcriptional regulator n=1 Tax=Aerococcaceae TaxID=186827 RepID=UPI0013D4564B|nr:MULTISPECIES: metal-dependent transcriptional regulator [unclassified Facklamia]MBK0348127.1 metal-dependent transcriptional regulator [Aerococcaceae bacterium zg-1578]MBR7927341.1 metal-dependent transcriptional regulator [Aerococcaceae bacterium zg-ZUI334]MBS4461456.1 metal-dependent transcriptional regulator [Aerococcaceae bacterium zg-B36]QQD65781.1 metal-dependent transcriptional regulator [Aerococcaceae bacterium zg-252]
MSQSREDYIKYIFEQGSDGLVSNKSISQGLRVSAPSVSEMIGKLSEEGLVSYERYQGAKLTESGKKMAIDLIRKHEIWEYFLERELGYNKDEVHELAEVLEHATSTELANRLAQYIHYPE